MGIDVIRQIAISFFQFSKVCACLICLLGICPEGISPLGYMS